jgi:hypothetical protein
MDRKMLYTIIAILTGCIGFAIVKSEKNTTPNLWDKTNESWMTHDPNWESNKVEPEPKPEVKPDSEDEKPEPEVKPEAPKKDKKGLFNRNNNSCNR